MNLEFSHFVEPDLDEIAAFIATDSPARAVALIRQIRARCADIAADPLIYQLRPDIGSGARRVSVGQYAILFRVADGVVRIERIVHGARDLPDTYAPPA